MVIRVYVRCSSDSQDVESQRYDLLRWLSTYGNDATVVWYVEEGISGDAAVRPQYNRLMKEVRKGDVVLCWALDRLSREGIVPVLNTVKTFTDGGIRLVSFSEPWIDSDNPASEVVIAVMAWAAAMEKKRIKARQRAGIDAARAAGKTWGGRKPGTMQVRTAEIDATVREMKAQGKSICAIARVVKISRPTIYNILNEQ